MTIFARVFAPPVAAIAAALLLAPGAARTVERDVSAAEREVRQDAAILTSDILLADNSVAPPDLVTTEKTGAIWPDKVTPKAPATAPEPFNILSLFLFLQTHVPVWLLTLGAVWLTIERVCMFAANFVSPSTVLGKIVHWVAHNGPSVQKAIVAAEDEVNRLSVPIPVQPEPPKAA